MDKVSSFVKMKAKVEIFMIFSRDIQRLSDLVPRMAQRHSFSCSQNRLDGVLLVVRGVLLRIEVLCAASRLPMKRPPELVCVARMQE
jgi:hypothetical protein